MLQETQLAGTETKIRMLLTRFQSQSPIAEARSLDPPAPVTPGKPHHPQSHLGIIIARFVALSMEVRLEYLKRRHKTL